MKERVKFGSPTLYTALWPVRGGQTDSSIDVDITANGSDGPVVLGPTGSVSIQVSLDPGFRAGQIADWWIVVNTPLAPPGDWYTYVYPVGWMPRGEPIRPGRLA